MADLFEAMIQVLIKAPLRVLHVNYCTWGAVEMTIHARGEVECPSAIINITGLQCKQLVFCCLYVGKQEIQR